jgi:Ser/Thr protein kinase RdoA (MazF antagonist)
MRIFTVHGAELLAMAAQGILKSYFLPQFLAARIETEYDLTNVQCQLISSTLRDVYLVTSRSIRAIFIIYRHNYRPVQEIIAEWELVKYLQQQGVPVASVMLTVRGSFLIALAAPEGLRYAVLTHYIAGTILRYRSTPDLVHQYGSMIATVHRVTDTLPFVFTRTMSIIDRLNDAEQAISSVILDRPTEVAFIQKCSNMLRERLSVLSQQAPLYGVIHGDVIRANALVSADARLWIIDFDLCGYGWRAYDIASYLATIQGSSDEAQLRRAFLLGYGTVRELTEEESRMIPLFIAIRTLFEIGTPAIYVNDWGNSYLYAYFDTSLKQLQHATSVL